jgi:hypothetical protein
MRGSSDDSGRLVGKQEVIQMGIKRISTDKSVVFSYGQCGRPLVHGTNLSDAGQKSASGKFAASLVRDHIS